MKLKDLKNKKIAVMGEGVEGKSSAKFLEKHGAKVEFRDQKHGKDYLKNLDKFDLVVRRPGDLLPILLERGLIRREAHGRITKYYPTG